MGRLDLTPLLPDLERLAGRLLEGVQPPPVGLVRQRLDPPVLADVEAAVHGEVHRALAGVTPPLTSNRAASRSWLRFTVSPRPGPSP